MAENPKADGPSTLTEVVNVRTGSVRVSGSVTAASARALRGTVEGLRREGHQRVVLHLDGAERIDDDGLAALHSLRERMYASGEALHIVGGPSSDEALPKG